MTPVFRQMNECGALSRVSDRRIDTFKQLPAGIRVTGQGGHMQWGVAMQEQVRIGKLVRVSSDVVFNLTVIPRL